MNNGVKNINSSLGGLKSMLGKVAVAAAAAFSVAKLVQFGKQAVETASDLQEVQNVVDTAFGESKQKMEDFADKAIETYGISKLTAKQTGSTFMAMAAGMGMANDYASDMAVSLTGLSADMSSFYNVSQDVASTALKSIFTGETETLKQFGIVMTDANLQAYALSQGITKQTSAMTQAEKVQLRYGFVMQQTALAQGDFAKTSDSWANQTRMLSEKWKEFGGQVGTVLMNILLPAVKSLNSLMASLINAATDAANALNSVFGVSNTNAVSSASALSDSTSDTADNYTSIADSAETVADATENQLASFDKMNKLSSESNSVSSSGSSAPTLSGGTINAKVELDTKSANKKIKKLFTKIKDFFNTLFNPIKSAWASKGQGVVDSIKISLNSIWKLIKDIGKSFATVWSNGTGETIVSNLLEYWSNLLEIIGLVAIKFSSAWNDGGTGTAIIQNILDIYNDILETSIRITDSIIEWAQDIDFSPLLTSFEGLTSALEPFTKDICDGIEWFWNNILLPMAKWTIEDAIPTFIETLSDVISGISSVCETAGPVLEDLWDNFLEPLASWTAETSLGIIKGLGKAFKKLCNSVDEKDIKVLIDLSGALAAIWAVAKGKKAFDKLGETISKNLSSATSSIKTWTSSEAFSKTAAEGGVGFGTKFCAGLAAFFVGWSIGSAIYDAWGDQINSIMFPVYDSAVLAWNKAATFFTETIPQFFTDFWAGLNNDILFPLYDTAVGAWDSVATFFTETIPQFFTDLWSGLNEDVLFPIYDSAVSAWNSVDEFFTETVPQFFSDLYESIKQIFAGIGGWFGERWTDIKGAFSGAKKWFSDKFSGAWSGIKEAFSTVGTWFGQRWTDIKGVFVGVKKWFSDKFSGAWSGIKEAFSGVGKFFDGVWDDMTAGLAGAVNVIIDGLNWMIDGINNLSFEMPDWSWLPDGVQGATLGFDIPEIPKLATGAVIPPNSEFLAILGDQKSGTNVEAPLSTIEQAVRNAMSDSDSGGGGDITIVMTLDGKTVYKTVVDQNKINKRKTGNNPLMI